MDVLAANRLAAALNPGCAPGATWCARLPATRRARELLRDWTSVAAETVATLRAHAPAPISTTRALIELVGELSLKSDDFRRLWARHDVREKARGTKRMLHPLVGELTLDYETFADKSAPGRSSSSTTPPRAATPSAR